MTRTKDSTSSFKSRRLAVILRLSVPWDTFEEDIIDAIEVLRA